MVDSQTSHLSFPDQPEYQPVGLFECGRVLHPYGAEPVDIEESPVVYLLWGAPPEGEPVYLLIEDLVEEIKGLRVTPDSVKYLHILIDKGPDFRTLMAKVPEAFFDNLLFPVSLVYLLLTGFRTGGEIIQRCHDAQTLYKVRVFRKASTLHILITRPTGYWNGEGLSQHPVFVIADK